MVQWHADLVEHLWANAAPAAGILWCKLMQAVYYWVDAHSWLADHNRACTTWSCNIAQGLQLMSIFLQHNYSSIWTVTAPGSGMHTTAMTCALWLGNSQNCNVWLTADVHQRTYSLTHIMWVAWKRPCPWWIVMVSLLRSIFAKV